MLVIMVIIRKKEKIILGIQFYNIRGEIKNSELIKVVLFFENFILIIRI